MGTRPGHSYCSFKDHSGANFSQSPWAPPHLPGLGWAGLQPQTEHKLRKYCAAKLI